MPGSAAPGNYTVTITATDSQGTQGSYTFTWTISDPITVTNPGNQASAPGAPVSLQIYINVVYYTDFANLTATVLPPGLTMNEYTRVISGAATAAGSTRLQ